MLIRYLEKIPTTVEEYFESEKANYPETKLIEDFKAKYKEKDVEDLVNGFIRFGYYHQLIRPIQYMFKGPAYFNDEEITKFTPSLDRLVACGVLKDYKFVETKAYQLKEFGS